jgi:hypothetical protein
MAASASGSFPVLAFCLGCSATPTKPAAVTSTNAAAVRSPASANPPAPPVVDSPAEPLADFDLGGAGLGDRRAEPEEVAAENAHFASTYAELPRLARLPDFLSVKQVLALLPESWREGVRERIERQLAGAGEDVLRGAYLDSKERQYLLWVHENLEQRLAVYDEKGAVTQRRSISRGMPYLRDVIALESEAEIARGVHRSELVVIRITSMSVCCLPSALELYALTPAGRLREIFRFARQEIEVGPGVRYGFLNHFEFTADRRAIVTRIYPEADGRWEFAYQAARGRYEPTAETQRLLRVPMRSEPKGHAIE